MHDAEATAPPERDHREIPIPSSNEELALLGQGYHLVAGIDEAGRGCLAGPVVAAAVIMPTAVHSSLPATLERVRDSKLLSPTTRQELYDEIVAQALGHGVGMVESTEIDAIGIVPATRRAMVTAIQHLNVRPEYLLIDYLTLSEVSILQKGIVHGDALCFSIAAASIVAKVTRDRLMLRHEVTHPGYGFSRHKGYGTREHLAALDRLGPCPIHRRTFAPVRDIINRKPAPAE